MLGDLKAKAAAAASKTGDAVKIKALEAEILAKRTSIKAKQQDLGVRIYPLIDKDEITAVKAAFFEVKVEVERMEQEIAAKQAG
eukprot:CAMPEP_0206005074 /NCGR_PEP_ID=MMETSP1464-20131121/4360_1 /ASSEMBLY_ACC=CAM_ASM_001124 /TAXON_ID=119497 /ORGANISM="Exanthemachrysis gayraliae, Strain RCC1523" /LENGTH=83 /DNA_ID=CAMNT_0053378497 /DNA_START=78 /DNA_END=325 /DNA_ORIENTATION=+